MAVLVNISGAKRRVKLKMLADYIDKVDKKFVNGLQYGTITNLKEVDDLLETIESFRKENCNEIELF